VKEARSPIQIAKAIKNETELQGFRNCHIRDSVALCKYFAWLENELLVEQNKNLNEVQVADKLEAFRA
jgi:Xaa-Pro aminopeptidase